jgi:hypothetical protein
MQSTLYSLWYRGVATDVQAFSSHRAERRVRGERGNETACDALTHVSHLPQCCAHQASEARFRFTARLFRSIKSAVHRSQ